MKDVMPLERGVSRAPPDETWPEADLEYLGKCPVCGEPDRSLAYSGLRDKVFFCAPGIWTSWRCQKCNVVYLDPRPTADSIGRAYDTYYTHHPAESESPATPNFWRKLRHSVPNSYLNKKFGYQLKPALPFGWLAVAARPEWALSMAHHYRHLPGPRAPRDRLLDIGCGNGAFLQIARDRLGYEVEGLEIDPRARDIALRRGLTVHASSIPGSGLSPGQYEQITMGHVLEHLHEPVAALAEAYSLLKPGGRIWIAVPNIAAESLLRFRENSRLLEPPRHLVMFDSVSLGGTLLRLGFCEVTLLPASGGEEIIYNQSWKIENGLDPIATPDCIIPTDERNGKRFFVGSKGGNAVKWIVIMTARKPS